jgi:hypothetical protein
MAEASRRRGGGESNAVSGSFAVDWPGVNDRLCLDAPVAARSAAAAGEGIADSFLSSPSDPPGDEKPKGEMK